MSDPMDTQRVDLEAAGWLVKRDRGLTPAEQDEFLQWRAADPRHAAWFARHLEMWGEFDQLAQWRPEHSVDPNPDLLARPRPRRRWLAPLSLAIAASLAVAWALWPVGTSLRDVGGRLGEPSRSAAQGYERRTLEDGSTVELNRGAAIDVRFTRGERRIALLGGEAHFTVAKDPARPFVVRARGLDVRAIGTAFNVRLGDGSVEVLVTHGKVEVGRSDDAHRGSRGNEAGPRAGLVTSAATELAAGERAIIAREAPTPPRIERVTPADIARALAWQPPQLLDFSSAPLERVVGEFNQRNRTQLVLADDALRSLPIVASVRSDNVDGFVRFLETTAGVQVEWRGADEIVLRRKP